MNNINLKSGLLKTLIKTVLWMSLGVLLMYLLTNSWEVISVYFIFRTIMYYVYEYLWKNKK